MSPTCIPVLRQFICFDCTLAPSADVIDLTGADSDGGKAGSKARGKGKGKALAAAAAADPAAGGGAAAGTRSKRKAGS